MCFGIKRVNCRTIWRKLAKTTRERGFSKEFWARSFLSLQRDIRMCDVIFLKSFSKTRKSPKIIAKFALYYIVTTYER